MDTQKTTSDLLASGLTQQELADLVPCSQSLINAFSKGKRGRRPSHDIANRLLALHAERCTPHPVADPSRPHAPAPP